MGEILLFAHALVCPRRYLVLEYAPNGELFDYLVRKGALDTHIALRLFQQIIEGVDYAHKHFVW